MPTPDRSRAAPRVVLARLLADHGAVRPNFQGLTTVTLLGRHELDAAVAVLLVVPVEGRCHPLTCLVFRGKCFAGLIRPILSAPQDFLHIVLQRDSKYGLSLDTPGLEKDLSRLSSSSHLSRVAVRGVPVVCMEDQRPLPCFVDPLSDASPTHQIRCNVWILTFGDIPGHDLAVPYIDHQVELHPDSANGGWKIRDVPTPHQIGCCSPEPLHGPGSCGALARPRR